MIDSYNKLTIGKFIELQDMDYTGMSEIDIQVKIISILAEMDETDVMDLPLPEYKELASATRFLSTPPKYEAKLPKKIVIDGKEFDVISDVKKMTAGQYIDYQTYIGMKDNKYLPHILSCFIIPKGEKYGETKLEDIIQLFTDKLNILYALSISAFFLHKWQSLTKATLRYLTWKMKRMKRKEKNQEVKEKIEKAISLLNTIKNGVGLDWLLELKK